MCKDSGFSLLELLLVMLLVSVIAVFGVPWTSHWFQDQVSWVMQHDIEQAIEHGIQKSLILGEPLRLVPLRDKDWSTGMALIQEGDLANHQHPILYTWPWRTSASHVIWHGFLSDAYLRFTPDIGQAALNGYFLIENVNAHGVKIMVNRVGRVRIARTYSKS